MVSEREIVPGLGLCSACGRIDEDLRPYGKGGALICFDCGMADIETTERQFGKVLDSAEVVVIRDDLRMPDASGPS